MMHQHWDPLQSEDENQMAPRYEASPVQEHLDVALRPPSQVSWRRPESSMTRHSQLAALLLSVASSACSRAPAGEA